MKYSFVLPAYKAAFLRESIDSILNQTYKDFELIIVNDASPEDLTSIVNSYQDERIQYYVNEKNVGGTDLVAQWNHCITYAQGEYLILASDDDVYHPDYLEKMDVLVDKYPNVNVFRPRVQYINSLGDVLKIDEKFEELVSHTACMYLVQQKKLISGVPFYVFKHQALKDMGGFVNFPSAWFSDDATAIQLAKDGMVIHQEVLFSFRNSGLNISSTLNTISLLMKKLSATELYYLWLARELKMVVDNDFVKSFQPKLNIDKLSHIEWLIMNSNRQATCSYGSLLRKVTSLSFSERVSLCGRVYRRKIKNKCRYLISRYFN